MTYANSYGQPADLYARYDTRILADMVNDDDTRLGSNTSVAAMQAALNTNQVILDVLADASGVINSACLVGQRYTVPHLQALTDVDQQFLVRLTCDLAWGLLALRRGVFTPDRYPQYLEGQETLVRLRQGDAVFNILVNEQAGVANGEFPSVQSYATLNLMRDYSTPRFFCTRRIQQITP
jgi:hypothetical protein